MELDAAIVLLESYIKGYIGYLIRVFFHADYELYVAKITDEKSRVLQYSLISALVGITLQQIAIAGGKIAEVDYATTVTLKYCFWISIALVAYVASRLERWAADIHDIMTVAIGMLSSCFFWGSFAAVIAFNLVQLFTPVGQLKPAHQAAAWIDAGTQVVLLGLYAPKAFATIKDAPPIRSRLVGVTLVIAVALADAVILVGFSQ